jgi:hypothetical protein
MQRSSQKKDWSVLTVLFCLINAKFRLFIYLFVLFDHFAHDLCVKGTIMPIYNAPLADMKFILNDVFKAEQFWQSNENLAHVDAATAEAILEEMAKFAKRNSPT